MQDGILHKHSTMNLEVFDKMATQAHREGNARHIAKLDIIKAQPYKAEGAAIRAAAAEAGQSIQAYILDAIRERMAREGLTLDATKDSTSDC